jgi:serine/threonine protein kinase
MTPERWRQVTGIFHAALERKADDRDAFVAAQCGDDAGLRRDVEEMLAAHQRPGPFSGSASLGRAALAPGTRLGPYEVISLLGAGGMGQVYRARDTRLSRTVAIKVLAPELAQAPQFHKRFEREARVIAGLEHPHICALFDIGEDHGTRFIVMQYLEGETLADRLTRGPLPVDQAIRHAVDMASALDAAHRAGVVHRDLKPANVMVTRSGVKLLDFGLARFDGAEAGPAGGEASTTTAALTQDGTVLGTLPYMAPEQVEGRNADSRSDIFALGAVLYEMTTGHRPFSGASQASLIAAIMSAQPPAISASCADVPPTLDRIVAKCLAKEPDARWQDAGDLAAALDWVLEPEQSPSAPAARPRLRTRAWALGVVLAATVAAAAAWMLKPLPPVPSALTAHFTIDLPPGAQLEGFGRSILTLSPDGRQVVYGARLDGKSQLFLRELDRPESKAIAQTDGVPAPFFSPDGQWVGFRADASLKKIAVGGGAPLVIATENGSAGASWGVDDHIIFARGFRNPLSRVAASGGEPEEVTTLETGRESSHRFPEVLPGGRAFIFTVVRRRNRGAVAPDRATSDVDSRCRASPLRRARLSRLCACGNSLRSPVRCGGDAGARLTGGCPRRRARRPGPGGGPVRRVGERFSRIRDRGARDDRRRLGGPSRTSQGSDATGASSFRSAAAVAKRSSACAQCRRRRRCDLRVRPGGGAVESTHVWHQPPLPHVDARRNARHDGEDGQWRDRVDLRGPQ